MTTIFEAAGGEAGLLRLAQAWHERVLADEVVAHAFSHGFRRDHTARLAAYWTEALGGPAAFSSGLGDETAVVRLHSGNGEHDEMDARAIECFDRALEDAGLAADERLRTALHDYFAWATTRAGPLPDVARRGPGRPVSPALVLGRPRPIAGPCAASDVAATSRRPSSATPVVGRAGSAVSPHRGPVLTNAAVIRLPAEVTVPPTLAPALTVTTIRTMAPLAMSPSAHPTVAMAGSVQVPLLATAPRHPPGAPGRGRSARRWTASGPPFATVIVVRHLRAARCRGRSADGQRDDRRADWARRNRERSPAVAVVGHVKVCTSRAPVHAPIQPVNYRTAGDGRAQGDTRDVVARLGAIRAAVRSLAVCWSPGRRRVPVTRHPHGAAAPPKLDGHDPDGDHGVHPRSSNPTGVVATGPAIEARAGRGAAARVTGVP